MYSDSSDLFGLGKKAQARKTLKAEATADLKHAKADSLRSNAQADATTAQALVQDSGSSSNTMYYVIGGVVLFLVIGLVVFIKMRKK